MRTLILILLALTLASCAGRRDWDPSTQSRWIIVQAKSIPFAPGGRDIAYLCGRYRLLEPYGKHYDGQDKLREYTDCSRERVSCTFGSKVNLLLEEMKDGGFWLRRVECFE